MSQTPSLSSELELNQIAKGIAILAVVFLHTLSTFFPAQIYQSGSTGLFFITINQICRFSVPLFIALSSFGLGKKYGNHPPSKLKFYLKQLKKLLPQYILWSLVLIFLFEQSLSWQNRSDIFQKLLTGRADYHFYFVPLIIKLYLIFPFLPRLRPKHYFLLAISLFILQFFYFSFIRFSLFSPSIFQNQLIDDQYQYRLVLNWFFYFIYGLFLSKINFKKIAYHKFTKLIVVLSIVFGLLVSVVDSDFLIKTTQNIVYATSFTRPSVLIYSTGIISLFLIYGQTLLKYIRPYKVHLLLIGKYSYIIYLSHTLFLRILKQFFRL